MGTGQGARRKPRDGSGRQQAISSPLLDNISIAGATGVLINITGGEDLTLGEVTQISEAIHDAAGDEAEIIFGALNDPAMHGEVRITVIATGFDKTGAMADAWRACSGPPPACCRSAIAALGRRQCRSPDSRSRPKLRPNGARGGPRRRSTPELNEMEIPTFIRRQMD